MTYPLPIRIEFLSELIYSPVGRKSWVLRAPLETKLFYPNGDEEWFIVPEGFEYDGASVPRLPLMYWLFGGRARKASTLHDYAYFRRRDRAWADHVFLLAMEQEESEGVRGLMYASVRLGGWTRYLEKKQWNEPPESSESWPSA